MSNEFFKASLLSNSSLESSKHKGIILNDSLPSLSNKQGEECEVIDDHEEGGRLDGKHFSAIAPGAS